VGPPFSNILRSLNLYSRVPNIFVNSRVYPSPVLSLYSYLFPMFYFVPLFFIHSFPRELLLLIKSGQDSYCLALGRVKKNIYVGTRRKCDGPKFEKKNRSL
jgi:hypothetical protein